MGDRQRHRPRRRTRPAFALAAAASFGLAALTSSETSHASPAARLVYVRSPEALSCPDEDTLRRAVAARFGYDPFFPWARATVVVQVWRERDHLRTRIQLVDDKSVSRGTRELSSDRPGCGEIFGATALAISIALETPTADEPAEAPADAPAPAPANAPAPAPASDAAPVPDSLPARVPPSRVAWDAAIEGLVGGDVARSPAPGVGVLGRARIGRYSIAVEGLGELSVPSASMQAAAVAGVVAPCAHLGPAFGCVVGELGALVAWVPGAADGRARAGLLAESGLRAGVEWPLSGAVALLARGDALANWLRHEIRFGGATWMEPRVTYAFAAGVVVRFR